MQFSYSNVKCNICSKNFKSERAMKTHRRMIHKEFSTTHKRNYEPKKRHQQHKKTYDPKKRHQQHKKTYDQQKRHDQYMRDKNSLNPHCRNTIKRKCVHCKWLTSKLCTVCYKIPIC